MAALNRTATAAPRFIPRRVSGRTLVLLAGMLVVLIAGVRVHQFSRLTSTGYQINDLERIRDARLARNHQVEAEVAALSSLARADWQARTTMGMVPPSQRIEIAVNQPVPERQTLPTRFLPVEPAASTNVEPAEDAPFWRRLLKLLPFF
jgi:hypothetical protein